MSKEERKHKVLKAAADCFARFGYEKTTLDDIGKLVGLNKASLYYYYKNKEDIFCDVIFQETELYMQDLEEKIKPETTVEGKILSYLALRMNYYKQVMNLHNLSIDVIRKVEPVFNEVYTQILQKEVVFLGGLIEEGIKSGEFIETDSKRIAEALLTFATSIRYREMHMSYVRMAAEADYSKILAEIRFIAQLILNGLHVTDKQKKRSTLSA